jgi:hypothetical protein
MLNKMHSIEMLNKMYSKQQKNVPSIFIYTWI